MATMDGESTKVLAVAFDYEANVAATTTGNIIDTWGAFGAESVTFITYIDTVTTADATNYFTINVYEDDAADLATGTIVAAANIIGTQTVLNEDDAAVDDTLSKFGVLTTKRYVRVSATETGTADATFSIICVKDDLVVDPQT